LDIVGATGADDFTPYPPELRDDDGTETSAGACLAGTSDPDGLDTDPYPPLGLDGTAADAGFGADGFDAEPYPPLERDELEELLEELDELREELDLLP